MLGLKHKETVAAQHGASLLSVERTPCHVRHVRHVRHVVERPIVHRVNGVVRVFSLRRGRVGCSELFDERVVVAEEVHVIEVGEEFNLVRQTKFQNDDEGKTVATSRRIFRLVDSSSDKGIRFIA